MVDNLLYTYTGNQLTALQESVRTSLPEDIYQPGATPNGTYEYDANGNMKKDSRKSLTFNYNALNLLSVVKENNAVKASYRYLADGTKTSVRNGNGNTGYDYDGSFVYTVTNNTPTLEAAHFVDGQLKATGVNYTLTDHLGSVRAIVDTNGTLLEQNDYYPFGSRHVNASYASSDNRYTFSGKESQDLLDLNTYDFGARMYDGGLSLWNIKDPSAEDFYPMSPYAFCANNPLSIYDPNGKKIVFVNGYLHFGSPKGGSAYWGGTNSSFVIGAKNFFHDKNMYFTDYDFSYFRSATSVRFHDGYNYAKENYKELTLGMNSSKDVFHIISHSMGGAFSEGLIKYLKEQGWTIDIAMHFNTWTPSELKGSSETLTIDITSTNDPVQWLSLPLNLSRDIPNAAYKIRKESDVDIRYIHRDLIDHADIWDVQNGPTWNQSISLIQSWIDKNPNIKISVR